MTSKDKVKRFIILTTSPHKLTQLEMNALWEIARHEGEIMFQYDTGKTIESHPGVGIGIRILRHVIGTLEHRGILKRRNVHQYPPEQSHLSWYTWDIVWKKTKSFEQTKELRVQKALGVI